MSAGTTKIWLSLINADCQWLTMLQWTRSAWHARNCARVGHTYQLSQPQTLQLGNCSTVTSQRWRVCGLCPSSPLTGRPVCCRPARSITRTVSLQCPYVTTTEHLRDEGQLRADVMVEVVQFCSCDDHCRDGEMWSNSNALYKLHVDVLLH